MLRHLRSASSVYEPAQCVCVLISACLSDRTFVDAVHMHVIHDEHVRLPMNLSNTKRNASSCVSCVVSHVFLCGDLPGQIDVLCFST